MGSSRLFNRRRSVHEIFGGGWVADLVLWRHKAATRCLLYVTSSTWLLFKGTNFTFLSFTSSVLLLCLSILYLWAKSAAILRRPVPPVPRLYVSEELGNKVAIFVRETVNTFLSNSYDIVLGKNTKLFVQVFTGLLLVRLVAGLTDLLTLTFITVVIGLTIPALYEKFEDCIDTNLIKGYRKMIIQLRRCNFEKHKLC